MASIESSLKYESEFGSDKVRLVSSSEFIRGYNHSTYAKAAWRCNMRLRKLVVAMITAFAAMLGHAGDSAPFVLNNATSPFGESVVLPWNAEWIGGNTSATVIITDIIRNPALSGISDAA